MTAQSFVSPGYQAGEAQISIRGRKAKDDVDKAIIVCHGRTPGSSNGCLQWSQSAGGGPPHLMYLCDYGYGIFAIDAGGVTSWGNDASITAVTNAVSWVKGATGWADPTKKVAVLGYSMGSAVALNYITRNPSQVAGFIGEAAVGDVSWMHDSGGFAAEIDTAYGGSWATNGAGHDPIRDFASSITTPTRLFSAVDDATVPNSQVHQLYTTLGSQDKKITDLPSGGHSGFWGFIDQQGLLSWLNGLTW